MLALFLDRDGTLIEDRPYQNDVQRFQICSGVVSALQSLKSRFKFFIVTNQSGIGRGYTNWDELNFFHRFLKAEFLKHDIQFEDIFVCPHRPDENCSCRKPSIAPLLRLERELGIDFKNSWMVGDKFVDVKLGKNFGGHSILVLTGQGKMELQEAKKVPPDFVAVDFFQVSSFILSADKNKFVERSRLKKWAADHRRAGRKLVTINGAFDLVHPGHVKILREAKRQGDILLVALNADRSISKFKGESRPVNHEQARARYLASFAEIDAVTIFSEDTPCDLLNELKPAVHVNGAEYGESCVEAEIVRQNGGRLHLVERLSDFSTTGVLKGGLVAE